MIGRWFRNIPIFWHTLALLIAGLIASQIVTILMFIMLDPPRPDFNRLGDVVEALEGAPPAHFDRREQALISHVSPTKPVIREGMVSNPAFTRKLAYRLDQPVERVLLYYEPDQRPFNLGRRHARVDPAFRVPIRRGEPLFFNTVIAGVETERGWRVVQTPPRPLISNWQKRMMLWFAISALCLVPFAWLFARSLARPIRRFAFAADRLQADPGAPDVPESGPAEIRTAANALNRMQRRLADYVAERTAMIGAIAHDLRTPLARIAFRIEQAPDEVRERVLADIEQMRAMISATIGFVQTAGQPAAMEDVALDGIVSRILVNELEMGRPVRAGTITPVTVIGDGIALERLFQNLVDNGVAYGGEVTISLVRAGDHAEVRFADRGPGLPPDQIERMFQPFARADPSRSRETGGIGLGLTIARSIAQRHGGTLTLANRDGGGLEAVCRLPIRA